MSNDKVILIIKSLINKTKNGLKWNPDKFYKNPSIKEVNLSYTDNDTNSTFKVVYVENSDKYTLRSFTIRNSKFAGGYISFTDENIKSYVIELINTIYNNQKNDIDYLLNYNHNNNILDGILNNMKDVKELRSERISKIIDNEDNSIINVETKDRENFLKAIKRLFK